MTSPNRAATQLTIDHRAEQVRVSRRVAAQVLHAWGDIDPFDVERAWPVVSRSIAAIITRGYAESVTTAVEYLRAHAAEYGVALRPATAGDLRGEQLATSIRVTGPVAVKVAASNGYAPVDASRVAAVQIVGASMRLALLGGRATIVDTVDSSGVILGWRRVGVGASCDFCSMLISRGAVYKSQASAGVDTGGFHDHDDCQVEPLYEGDAEPLDIAEHFARYVATR